MALFIELMTKVLAAPGAEVSDAVAPDGEHSVTANLRVLVIGAGRSVVTATRLDVVALLRRPEHEKRDAEGVGALNLSQIVVALTSGRPNR